MNEIPSWTVAVMKSVGSALERGFVRGIESSRPTPRATTNSPVRAAESGGFGPGQQVTYRQGRGTFDAQVISVDTNKNVVTLRRVSDGKVVVRPSAKVYR